MLKCAECGFTDPDVTFFYLGDEGEHYCSLHQSKWESCGACGEWNDPSRHNCSEEVVNA